MTLIQNLALAFAALFFLLAGIAHAPNGDGLLSPQWHDDLLYAFSGGWALVGALISRRQSALCFQLVGPVYLFDGIVGVVTGSGCLQGTGLVDGFASLDDVGLPLRVFANAPHLATGGLAMLVGLCVAPGPREAAA